jgi:hypothetical protein
MRENKSSRNKTQNKGQSKALFSTDDFSKDDSFTCADPSPFIGRWTDFLHPEDTLMRKGSKRNVLGYFWKVSD